MTLTRRMLPISLTTLSTTLLATLSTTLSTTLLTTLSTTLSTMLLITSLAVPSVALADDFPTSGRVEYVLECMQKHDGKQEFLYKCSCVVDRIALTLRYDDFVAMSVALRNQSLSGERGSVFRDAPTARDMAGKFRAIEAGANQACAVPQLK